MVHARCHLPCSAHAARSAGLRLLTAWAKMWLQSGPLRLHKKNQSACVPLQDAAARLARGAQQLAARLDREQRYYGGAAQLQREWKLRAGQPGQPCLHPALRWAGQHTCCLSLACSIVMCMSEELQGETALRYIRGHCLTGALLRQRNIWHRRCCPLGGGHQPAL